MSLTRRQTLLGALAGFLKPILPKRFPVPRFIRAPRFEIPFFTISSEKFEKTSQELRPMDFPTTKLLDELQERIAAGDFGFPGDGKY